MQEHDYIDYLSADLVNPKALVKMDLTEIEYPNNSFDVVYCSHVLEHIQDDSCLIETSLVSIATYLKQLRV
ncbi:methyltransferase domain-containing protein [Novipirellula sp. SH528]|uniref:methyltransferase domain-containing protein n=1 Tax=Novipirellula sp. SH528 TaxID=3454466 RepID=UPI003FA0D40A